jgi:hypothetical protein
MDKFVLALGPVFAAGFAVQRLLEILDPIVQLFTGTDPGRKRRSWEQT